MSGLRADETALRPEWYMFPLYDNLPAKRMPWVTVAIIAVNVFVFVSWQLKIGLEQSVVMAGLVPVETFKAPVLDTAFRVLSAMFMHGGWMHLIGNMWFLWIFGNNIEDSMGSVRFAIFYLLCGVAADALHVLATPESHLPMIGASGAVSGVLGAYLLLHPKARVLTFVPIVFFFRILELPAFLFLLIWVGFQIMAEAMVKAAPQAHVGGVAYLAHIGGFAAGMLLIFFFQRKKR